MSPIVLIVIAAGAASLIGVFLYFQNNAVVVTRYDVETEKSVEDFRIVHLSDLHNKTFRKGRLFQKIRAEKPNLIAVTGDFISRWTKGCSRMLETARKLENIAPVYFVPGNHEYGNPQGMEFMRRLSRVVTACLQNETAETPVRGVVITALDEIGYGVRREDFLASLDKTGGFKILLSHYADYEEEYQTYDVDLVLSGHAHGGQFILPLIGGLYSSTQGVFPKHYRGMTKRNGTFSVISRGLGNSRFPFRLFNYPEIVSISVHSEKKL